jgi:3'(2'), 5'-bisphosphate nucleotidase
MTDVELARHIAEVAGKILVDLQHSGLFEGKALGKVGDRVANAFIMEALKSQRPDDAILSEEEKDNAERLNASRVWIVDPLDGTREYGEQRTDWAVHIALAIDGVATIGAVALPGVPLTLCSGRPAPVPGNEGKLRMLVSRTRPAAEAVAVAEALGAELVPMGSAGAKAMAILQGKADVYVHAGGMHEWDAAAPVVVAVAGGLHVSKFDGTPLDFNTAEALSTELVICLPELADQVLAAVAKARA